MKPLALFIVAVGVVAAGVASAAAQMGRPMAMGYDKSKEVTVTGTVEAVMPQQGMRGMGGTHLTLNIGADKLDVHVGPTPWLADKKYEFAAGDQLTIIGSRQMIDKVDSLIAREIDKGGTKISLRDENGRPLWAGGMRGRPRSK